MQFQHVDTVSDADGVDLDVGMVGGFKKHVLL